MLSFEIWNGDCYRFTVMPSERPKQVLQEERRRSRNSRLRMVMIEDGIRTEVEGPSIPEPEDEDAARYGDGYEEE